MTRLTNTKEDTLKHLQDKILEGNVLLNKCIKINGQNDYEVLIDEHENWRDASENILKQIFDDASISKNFGEVGFITIDTEASFFQKVYDFKNDITKDIAKLQIIYKDVYNDVYNVKNNLKIVEEKTTDSHWYHKGTFWGTVILIILTLLLVALALLPIFHDSDKNSQNNNDTTSSHNSKYNKPDTLIYLNNNLKTPKKESVIKQPDFSKEVKKIANKNIRLKNKKDIQEEELKKALNKELNK